MKANMIALAALFLTTPAMAQNIETIERNALQIHIFLSKPVIFQVASVVLESEREIALVDAQFSADNASLLVELIKSIGKPLSTIFISHSDPDYYFGLEFIAREFPDAKIITTPQTRYLINATKEDKLNIWGPQLGDNAPQKIIVPEAISQNYFMLENTRIEIIKIPGDEHHSFLWIPTASIVLGGAYLSDNEHLWVADSPTKSDREKWITTLELIKNLNPEYSIPAHFIPRKNSFKNAINFTEKYLITLENILSESKNSNEVINKMKKLYPNLGYANFLELGAKVLKGETTWKTALPFPAIGRKAEVNFGGEYIFELYFHDDKTMTFRGLVERQKGRPITDTVTYTAIEIAPLTYMVYWTERDNTHVVHIEDFGRGVVYTNISAPDGSFINLYGTLKLLQ